MPEERSLRIVRGVLHDINKPDYSALYEKVIDRAKASVTGKEFLRAGPGGLE